MTLARIQRPLTPGRRVAKSQPRSPATRASTKHDPSIARPLSSFPLGARTDPAETRADAHAGRVARALDSSAEAMTSAASPSPARERLARPGPIAEQHFPDRGRPLAPSIRRRLEPELGVDLSTVRLHTSGEAGELAHRLSARAFTLGNHIVLGRESDLQSHAGQRLLAHELGHLPEQASAAPQIRRSPYSIDPTLAQQGTTAPELVPSLESTKAAMALLNADERELYVAAVREWVSACGHGQELLEIVQQIHSPLVGPQPDDWFPESIRRQVAALPAATIYSPFKVLAIIEVSRNLAAQGVGPQLTTPTLTVPSPAASQQQGTQLAQPQSLASLTPAS